MDFSFLIKKMNFWLKKITASIVHKQLIVMSTNTMLLTKSVIIIEVFLVIVLKED